MPVLALLPLAASTCVSADEVGDAGKTKAVRQLLTDNCSACHNADDRNGKIDVELLLKEFDPAADSRDWEKIEEAVVQGRMPPKSEQALTPQQIETVRSWFHDRFVMVDGVQHAGRVAPRRLTREELQNTLEDLLHINIRAEVTNSRLHVIPDTIIEKFFSAGVVGESGFSNDAEMLRQESIDIQTYARCFSLVLSTLDSSPDARTALLGTADLPPEPKTQDVRSIIERFAGRAFRRPVTPLESEAIVAVFDKEAERGRSSYVAMKSAFLAVLLSPQFLFRLEEPVDESAPVSDVELATRLSYFLWSTSPDEELQKLAGQGRLNNDDVLRQQVPMRMTTDWRSESNPTGALSPSSCAHNSSRRCQ